MDSEVRVHTYRWEKWENEKSVERKERKYKGIEKGDVDTDERVGTSQYPPCCNELVNYKINVTPTTTSNQVNGMDEVGVQSI